MIIPVHNARDTLKKCLDSVFQSSSEDFEVIVVEDGSVDDSALIAKEYPCKIVATEKNIGAGSARNLGKEHSVGEVLVFVDSDVVLKPNTLDVIGDSFEKHRDIVAVTGLLSDECPFGDFFSQYKNLYMNFIFRKCSGYVEFLYGSIIAIARDSFIGFDEKIRITDDTELGQRYKELGKKILLNPDLEVVHLKEYDFFGLVKNDFSVPFWWAKSFIMHKGYEDVYKKRRFSHAQVSQILSIVVSYLLAISVLFLYQPWVRTASLALLILFLVLNLKFFIFLHGKRGMFFMLKSLLYTYVDMLVMGLGIVTGLIYHALA